MQYYNYSTDLPFSGKVINFREINTGEQIALAKANLSFPNNRNNYYDFNNFILKVFKNCIESPKEIDNLNIIDYVLFVTKLRIVSIGHIIELVSEVENQETKTVKTTIDLNVFLRNLYNAANDSLVENEIFENDIMIKLNWPTVSSIKLFQSQLNQEKSEFKLFSNTFQEFIEYIKIGDKKIFFESFNTEEKIKITEKLTASLLKKTQKTILEALNFLSKQDLFGLTSFKEHTFNFYTLNFIDYIRLFFSYDIKSLYKEIYYFSEANLLPDYIMNISQSERKIYSAIIEEQKRKKNNDVSYDFDKIGSKPLTEVEKLAVEFGESPPN